MMYYSEKKKFRHFEKHSGKSVYFTDQTVNIHMNQYLMNHK